MKKTDTGRAGERPTPEVDYGIDDRLLPLPAVMQIAGIGKTMIYRLMGEGNFPQSCKPGGASVRWSEREVKEWKEKVLEARRS